MNDKVSVQKLESYYHISVQIVSIHGERFLPLFEKIRDELESKKREQAVLDFVKQEVKRINK